jgi:hypothetical protein
MIDMLATDAKTAPTIVLTPIIGVCQLTADADRRRRQLDSEFADVLNGVRVFSDGVEGPSVGPRDWGRRYRSTRAGKATSHGQRAMRCTEMEAPWLRDQLHGESG